MEISEEGYLLHSNTLDGSFRCIMSIYSCSARKCAFASCGHTGIWRAALHYRPAPQEGGGGGDGPGTLRLRLDSTGSGTHMQTVIPIDKLAHLKQETSVGTRRLHAIA